MLRMKRVEQIACMALGYKGQHDTPLPGKFGTYLGRGDGVVNGEVIETEVTGCRNYPPTIP